MMAMPFEIRRATRTSLINAKGMATGKVERNTSKNTPECCFQVFSGNPGSRFIGGIQDDGFTDIFESCAFP